LKSFQGRLEEWKGLLQRFLKDEDDQVNNIQGEGAGAARGAGGMAWEAC
jgi:hypothetical protein